MKEALYTGCCYCFYIAALPRFKHALYVTQELTHLRRKYRTGNTAPTGAVFFTQECSRKIAKILELSFSCAQTLPLLALQNSAYSLITFYWS